MRKLDLHGVKHSEAGNRVDTFIRQNINSLPIEIITGNSYDMTEIVKRVVSGYALRMNAKSITNLGSYIINNRL